MKRWREGARRARPVAWVVLVAAAVAVAVAPALGDTTEEKLSDLVQILREEGVISEAQYAEMAAKASKQQAVKSWTDRFSLWADFRARYEGFFYEQDVFARTRAAIDPADRLHDRHRARYRARINLRGEVISRAAVYFRLTSGDDDPRNGYQTLGSGPDFTSDPVRIDLAYATLSPFENSELPGIEGGLLAVDVGKVVNPFRWKEMGDDRLVWDPDITPEGASLRIRGGAGPVMLFSNSGLYIIAENAASKDPTLFGAQLGGTVDVADAVSVGSRVSIYDFFSLDDDFFMRGATGGNIVDGLSRANRSIQLVATSAFVAVDRWELFPMNAYGTYAHNLSARSSQLFPGVDREDDAWVVGLLVGDKKRLVRLGGAYYYVEANSLPSMYIDDEILDGFTNRKGWAFSAERQLLDGVDFRFTAYLSERIEGGAPFAVSGYGAERLRILADLDFKL